MGHLNSLELPALATLGTFSLSAVRNATALFVIYLVTLSAYRLWFHPLASHPGPTLAKLTDWYSVYFAWRGDRHLQLHYAHQKYGSIVRFGPNLLSFNSAGALKSIYGHTPMAKSLQKSSFYLAFPAVKGVHNTHNAISKLEHGRKRRVLSAAFSDTALKSLEPLVLKNVDVLLGLVTKADGKALNIGDLFSYFTFDVMGSLCFGVSFDMLTSPASRFVTNLIDRAAHMHYLAGQYLPIKTTFIGKVLFRGLVEDRWRFITHSRACADARMAQPVEAQKDFFYHLLHAVDSETGKGFTQSELWGEANVLMIAGSDTTGTALSAAAYYLARTPNALKKLQAEVREAFNSKDEIISGAVLNNCHYLKACIDEAMRMAPPVPGLLPREVIAPCQIDGVDVPIGTVVGTPIYALHHNTDVYDAPFEFRPERWIEDSDRAHEGFTPFSIGARGCIGKGVAYMEMRLVLARLAFGWEWHGIQTEDGEAKSLGIPEGFGYKAREGGDNEYAMLDHFTSSKVGPVMKFEERKV